MSRKEHLPRLTPTNITIVAITPAAEKALGTAYVRAIDDMHVPTEPYPSINDLVDALLARFKHILYMRYFFKTHNKRDEKDKHYRDDPNPYYTHTSHHP